MLEKEELRKKVLEKLKNTRKTLDDLEAKLKDREEKAIMELKKKRAELYKAKQMFDQLIELLEKSMMGAKIPYDKVRDLLCFRSLAYCCGLDKPCLMRDTVRAILGIDDATYETLKDEFDKRIKELFG